MQDILIISTGGTFNKIYNPIKGSLDIDDTSSAIFDIAKKWQADLTIENIISKDSLDFTSEDRALLLESINNAKCDKIIIIHGTDTMEISANFISKNINNKSVVFTGAMVPYWIDKVEACANLAMALGYMLSEPKDGVYIAMNGLVLNSDRITKDRAKGCFVAKEL